jgi:hypothetical protein
MRSPACTIAQSRCLHINRSLGPKYLRLCSITHVALARRRACQAIGHHVEAPRVVDPQCVHCRGHERPPPRRVQHRAVQVVLERPRCLRAPTLCRAAGRGLHGRPGFHDWCWPLQWSCTGEQKRWMESHGGRARAGRVPGAFFVNGGLARLECCQKKFGPKLQLFEQV